MLVKLKRARVKELAAEIEALAAKEDATAEDIAKIEKVTGDIEALEKDITILEKAEAARARAAVPASTPVDKSGRVVFAQPKELTNRDQLGVMVKGIVHAYQNFGNTNNRSVLKSIAELGYETIAADFEVQQKIANTTQMVTGGFLVPENVRNEIIDILYPETAFFRGNPQVVPMPNGSFSQPAGVTGATASWTGELQPISPSEPTFRDIHMRAHALTGMVPMTQNFMDFTIPGTVAWVERQLRQAISQELDRGLFRGDGLVNAPLGIFNIPGITDLTPITYVAATTPTVVEVDRQARALLAAVSDAFIPPSSLRWIVSAKAAGYLVDARDGNGNAVFPTMEGPNPTFKGIPVIIAQGLPSNLGGTGDESDLALVAFNYVLFGDVGSVEMRYSDEGTAVINGTVYSAIQHRMAFLTAVVQGDVNLQYLKAVAKVRIRWGA